VEKRIGCVTIILERQKADVGTVNELVSQFGDTVVGRLGLPYPERGVNIITLIVDASVERVSALTGKLGKLPGVQVKSLMARNLEPGEKTDECAAG
jgi:putative iron-only hydrogenase system regulator